MKKITGMAAKVETQPIESREEFRGVEASISRREFIGATLIGSSAVLLAAAPDVLAASGGGSKGTPYHSKKSYFERIKFTSPLGQGHPETPHKIAGKRIWYHYAGGYTFEQHYIDEEYIVWKGIGDEVVEGYSQKDRYHCFEIRPDIYVIVWAEEETIADPKHMKHFPGPWPVYVVADFKKLRATVSFTNPDPDGFPLYIVDQARLEIKEG